MDLLHATCFELKCQKILTATPFFFLKLEKKKLFFFRVFESGRINRRKFSVEFMLKTCFFLFPLDVWIWIKYLFSGLYRGKKSLWTKLKGPELGPEFLVTRI